MTECGCDGWDEGAVLTGRMQLDAVGRNALLTLGAAGLALIAIWAVMLRDWGPLPAFVGLVLSLLAIGLWAWKALL